MTPQKNQPKVVRATGKGKPTPLLQQLRNLRLSIGKRSSPESRVGKPFRNTAWPHHLPARRPCGFHLLHSARQGEAYGGIPTRQGSNRGHSGQ